MNDDELEKFEQLANEIISERPLILTRFSTLSHGFLRAAALVRKQREVIEKIEAIVISHRDFCLTGPNAVQVANAAMDTVVDIGKALTAEMDSNDNNNK